MSTADISPEGESPIRARVHQPLRQRLGRPQRGSLGSIGDRNLRQPVT